MNKLLLAVLLSACGTTMIEPTAQPDGGDAGDAGDTGDTGDAGVADCTAGALGTWSLTFHWDAGDAAYTPEGPQTDTLTVFEAADGGLDADFASVQPLSDSCGGSTPTMHAPVYTVTFDPNTCLLDVADSVSACFNGEALYDDLQITVRVAGEQLSGGASYHGGSWAPHGQHGSVAGQRN